MQHPWKYRSMGLSVGKTLTREEQDRKRRLAEIGAAVIRMKLRQEGRLK